MPLKICLEIAAVATVTALVLLKLQHCALSGGTMKKAKNVERGLGFVWFGKLQCFIEDSSPDYVAGLYGASGW